MPWLPKLARNLGLAVHHVIHPEDDAEKKSDKREVSRTVEEGKLNPTTTLRRTTIEEIEVTRPPRK